MNESDCIMVSSRGIMKSCDVYPPNPISSTRRCYDYPWPLLKSHSTVYVNGSAIPDFIARAWPQIEVPIILVSGDCDETIPYDIFPSQEAAKTFVNDKRLIAWFSQNMVPFHPTKVYQIPIGMDYHTLSVNTAHPWGPQQTSEQQEKALLMLRERNETKKPTIFANFHFSMKTRYGADRIDAIQKIPKGLIFYPEKSTSRFLTWAIQKGFTFVASPWGGGLDCHRTWEALALGCYPILHSSDLDPMFRDLPVLIVKSWSEVTQECLDAFLKKQEGESKKIPEKLTLKYWTYMINLFKN